MEDLSLATEIELTVRLLVALLLGAVIGWERELQRMPAGFRTHALVALGSAIFTVVSAFAFTGSLSDPTRIAAQIVSGVGFLGAGTIFRTPSTVRGLTTAASIWLVAAVGLLAGAGLYVVAIATTLGGFATLRWGRPPSRRRRIRSGEPSILGEADETVLD